MIKLADTLVAFANWLWGLPLIITLTCLSIFMSIRIGFVQFKHFGYILKSTLFGSFKKKDPSIEGEGTLSAFQALTSAVACTVGAGNIAGVPIAIILGGPGAVFWMWCIALLGMALKYSEIVLAVKYRDKNEKGEWVGGPTKYMSKGIHGPLGKILAALFAIFLMIEVAISSMTQTNQLAASAVASMGIKPLITGIIVMFLVAIVLLGGIKTLGKFTEKMVPIMAGVYILCALVIVFVNIKMVPEMLALIVKCAFTGHAALGGFTGATIAAAVRFGFARGLYSNEAGVGTAPIAHATATTDHPSRQGLWGVTEIFLDTIVICTCTAFVVLATGAWSNAETVDMSGADVTTFAFSTVFGKAGGWIVTISLMMFVFSTLLVLIWYGEKQAEYIFGSTKAAVAYRVVCILLIPVGAIGAGTYLWQFLDLSLGLALIPNLIAIAVLNKEIVKCNAEFFGTKDRYYLADLAMKQAKKAGD